jgi:hypothetical protein
LRGLETDVLAATGKQMRANGDGVSHNQHRDDHGAHRFRRRAAARPRDAGDGDADIRTGAQDPVAMATAMRYAVDAGRLAYLAGRMPRREVAVPSSPERGMLA